MWDGDLTGEVVDGRYALGNLYGSGGMAEVYQAQDTRLDRAVAMKFFQGEATGEDRIRLDREAQVLGALHCPGLVEVYGTGVYRGRPYIVMQPVDGGTLRRRMREALPPEVVAAIGAQVAGTLAHVHAHDVVHRDVKPSNILLDTTGRRAYLADFGLALQGQVTRVTRTGILVGTAGYLAPEQVRGGDVLPAADIYALGLVLLECLTGRPEYPGGDTEAALARLHREPRVPANLPEPWTTVLTAMTSSHPTTRPTAAECEALLVEAARVSVGLPPLAAVEVTERPAEPVPVTVPPAPQRTTGRRVLVGGMATALALTAVVLLHQRPPAGQGTRPEQAPTTAEAEPIAEPRPTTDADVAPQLSAPATVFVREQVSAQPAPPPPPPPAADDGAGGDSGVDDGAGREPEGSRARQTPVVVVPTVTPTVVGPPSRERGPTNGAEAGKG